MKDIVIIGSGPAGISLALYLKRAKIDCLILTTNQSNLLKAEKIDNYYGVDNLNGQELYELGLKQAKELNVEIKEEEVVDIELSDIINIKTNKCEYQTKNLVLAIGSNLVRPNVKGIKELEGRGVSYCATCDGFFYKDKKIGVLGSGEFALNEIKHLQRITNDITVFTNGTETDLFNNLNVEVVSTKIKEISGTEKIKEIITETDIYEIEGLFVALGANAFSLSKKLGLQTENNNIIVNNNFETNIPNIYAIGDVIGGFKQIAKAVSDGALLSKVLLGKSRK